MYSKTRLCQCDSERTGRRWLVDGESGDVQSVGADTADEEYDSIDDLAEVEETYGQGLADDESSHADDVDGNGSASKWYRIWTSCKWSQRSRPKKRRILLNEVSM